MMARCLAGTLLGFPLAAALIALPLRWLPHGGAALLIPAMILFFPLWIALMAGSYMFRSGARAWMVLAIANAAAFLTLWATRSAGF